MGDGIHWQDPHEALYNQPACGVSNVTPCATDKSAVTCPVCLGEMAWRLGMDGDERDGQRQTYGRADR